MVCDAKLKIRNIVARWRGSTHDSRIFNESLLKQSFEEGLFHGRLLGDSGYACTPYLFTPLLNPRTRKEKLYNDKNTQHCRKMFWCVEKPIQMFINWIQNITGKHQNVYSSFSSST